MQRGLAPSDPREGSSGSAKGPRGIRARREAPPGAVTTARAAGAWPCGASQADGSQAAVSMEPLKPQENSLSFSLRPKEGRLGPAGSALHPHHTPPSPHPSPGPAGSCAQDSPPTVPQPPPPGLSPLPPCTPSRQTGLDPWAGSSAGCPCSLSSNARSRGLPQTFTSAWHLVVRICHTRNHCPHSQVTNLRFGHVQQFVQAHLQGTVKPRSAAKDPSSLGHHAAPHSLDPADEFPRGSSSMQLPAWCPGQLSVPLSRESHLGCRVTAVG